MRARLGRGKKCFTLGYLSLFLVDVEGFPLGHVEAPLNVNEKQLAEELLTRVLGESLEVELLAADSQFESHGVFDLLEALKIGSVIAWRRPKGRENPPDVLTVKDRIDVEGPDWMRAVYKRLRTVVEDSLTYIGGDVIVEADGVEIRSFYDLLIYIQRVK
jgi:hypothetical protein